VNGEELIGASPGLTSFEYKANGTTTVVHNGRRLDKSDVVYINEQPSPRQK
jgi:hypothetical protein